MSYSGYTPDDGGTYDPTALVSDSASQPSSSPYDDGSDDSTGAPDLSAFDSHPDPTAAVSDFADSGGTGTNTDYSPPDPTQRRKSTGDPTADVSDSASFADGGGTAPTPLTDSTSGAWDPTAAVSDSYSGGGTGTTPDAYTSDPTVTVSDSSPRPPRSSDPTAAVSDSAPSFADAGGTGTGYTGRPDPTALVSDSYTPADTRQAGATVPSGAMPYTPAESLAYGNAAANVYSIDDSNRNATDQVRGEVQQEGASLRGEWDDLKARIDAYNQSGQYDPTLEASLNGEVADLQQRSDAYQNRPASFYDDRFTDPTAAVSDFNSVVGGIDQTREATANQSQLNDFAGYQQAGEMMQNDITAQVADRQAFLNRPGVSSELSDPNSSFAYGRNAFPPDVNAQIEASRTGNLAAFGGDAAGPVAPGSIQLDQAGYAELQRVQQQYGDIADPRAYYQVQGADGTYAGNWVPVGDDPAQLADVQARANLPKSDPNNVRVVSASTFGVSGPPQPDAVPTTHLADLSKVAAISGLASLAVLGGVGIPLVVGSPIALSTAGVGTVVGSYLGKGTGETVGQTGLFGTAPGKFVMDVLGNAPVVGNYFNAIRSIPIPEAAQNPWALVTEAVQAFKDDPMRLNPIILAGDIFKNGIAGGGIANAWHQSPETFGLQSGIQQAGPALQASTLLKDVGSVYGAPFQSLDQLVQGNVRQAALDLTHPVTGIGSFLSDVVQPVDAYRTVYQTGISQGLTPQAASDAAFAKTNNGIADLMRTLDVFNPLTYAFEMPVLEQGVKALFGVAGVTARNLLEQTAYGSLGDVANSVTRLAGLDARTLGTTAIKGLDLFTNLSLESATRMTLADTVRDFGTKLGRFDTPGRVGGSAADLLEAFLYKDVDPAVRDARLADFARDYLGNDLTLARSMSDRAGYGAQQRLLANGVSLQDVPAQVEKYAATLRAGEFTPQQLAATSRAFTFGAGDAVQIQNQTAFRLLAEDLRAAAYKQAGLPIVTDYNAAQTLVNLGARTVRQMFLMPGVTALALKKIPDEFIRGVTQGVWGLNPVDFQLTRTLAGRLAGSDTPWIANAARDVQGRSVVRQMLGEGLPIDSQLLRAPADRVGLQDFFAGKGATDNYGNPLSFAARLEALAGAPSRMADKVLEIGASSPTSHVRLNAARQSLLETGGQRSQWLDETLNGMAQYGVSQRDLTAARSLFTGAHPEDVYKAANFAEDAGSPRLPSTAGQSRYTPASARVTADINRTPQGLVGQAGVAGKIPQGDPRAIIQTYVGNLNRIPATSPIWNNTVSDVTRGNARALGYTAEPGVTNRELYTAVAGRPPEAIPLRQGTPARQPDAFNQPMVGGTPAPTNRARAWADTVLDGNGAGFTVPQDVRTSARDIGITYQGQAPNDFAQTIRAFKGTPEERQAAYAATKVPGNVSLTPDGMAIDTRGVKSGGDYWASRNARDANFQQRVDAAFNKAPSTTDGTVGQRVTQSTAIGPTDYQYRVVPLEDLRINAPGIQTRPRDTSVLSQQQVAQMVRDFQPDRLLADVGAVDTGPMIVGADRAVESGNGRAMALTQLANTPEGRPAWEAYQAGLREYAPRYGIDPASLDGITNPVLVRENLTPFATPADRRAFVDAANASPVLQRTAQERIGTDARALTDGLAGRLEVGPTQRIDDALRSNADVIRGFVANIQREDPNALGGLLDSRGMLTTEGIERFKAALATKAYGTEAGTAIADRLFFHLDPDYRGIGNAIEDSLPQMALGVTGKPSLNLGDDLRWSLDKLSALKQNGEIGSGGIREWIDRPRMIADEGLTPARADLLTTLYENRQRPSAVREMLQNYAERAGNQPIEGQAALGLMAPVTKEDLLTASLGPRGATNSPQSGFDIAAGGGGGMGYRGTNVAERAQRGYQGMGGPLQRSETTALDAGFGGAPRADLLGVSGPGARLGVRLPQSEGDVARYVADVQSRLATIPTDQRTAAINGYRRELHRTNSPAADRALQALGENGIRDPARVAAEGARNVSDAAVARDLPRRGIDAPAIGSGNVGDTLRPRGSGIDRHDYIPPDIQAARQPTDTWLRESSTQPITARRINPADDPTAMVSDSATGRGISTGTTLGNARGIPPGGAGGYPRLLGLPQPATVPDFQGLADYLRGQGQKLDAIMQGRASGALERGNRIIGNFREQTPIGELLSRGTINGASPLHLGSFDLPVLPALPFASFHVHTTQFWADYFLQHPMVPFAIARTLNQYGVDEYGGVQTKGGYVGGVTNPFTAAHLVDWAMQMYGYAVDAIRNPNGNNPLQTAAKIVGYGTVGNNGYVRPFDYYGAPAQGILQSTTNPLLTPKGQVDPREQMKEMGAPSFTSSLAQYANRAVGSPLSRNVVNTLGNPGQPLTNLIRNASIAGVNRLGGTADVTAYRFTQGIPYMADTFGTSQGWDAGRKQAAVNDAAAGSPVTADGRALLDAYQRQQDRAGLAKGLPVQFNPESGTPIYPQTNSGPFFYSRNAGEGGRDGGVNVPTKAGGTFLETRDAAAQNTARAQLKLGENPDTPYSVAPEFYPTINYARDYLGQVGDNFLPPGGRAESQAIADRSSAIYQGSLNSAARRTENSNAFFYDRNAGQGGRDAGINIPTKAGGTYLEPLDQAAQNTARAQLREPVTLGNVPSQDYARDYLQGVGNNFMPNRPESQAVAQRSDALFQSPIDANARRTGAGLPQDQRLQQIGKTEALQTPVGRNPDGTPFTLGALLAQPGNANSIEAQLKGMPAGPQKTALENALADVKAKDAAQSPAAAAYFAQQDATFRAGQVNRVTGNPKTDGLNVGIDGTFTVGDFLSQPGNLFDLDKQYADAKARGASAKELYALLDAKDKVLASDLALHSEVRGYLSATDQLKYADGSNKPSRDTATPRATGSNYTPRTTSYSGSTGRSSGGASSSTANPANTFFDEYHALIKGSAEYHAVLADPIVRDLFTASGNKTASAAQYDRALTALRDDVQRARNSAAQGAPAGSAAARYADLSAQTGRATAGASRAFGYQPSQAEIEAATRGIVLAPDWARYSPGAGLPGSGQGASSFPPNVTPINAARGLPGSAPKAAASTAQKTFVGRDGKVRISRY